MIFRPDENEAQPTPTPQYFTGAVKMQNFGVAAGAKDVAAIAVHFPQGARTRPHTHTTEQVLHFVRGNGFVHMAGEDERRVPEGTVVIVPAGAVHMHGATDDGPTCHVALWASQGETNWEPDGVPADWARWQQ